MNVYIDILIYMYVCVCVYVYTCMYASMHPYR